MANDRPVTSGRTAAATDLRKEILSIVHGLQFGHGRRRKDGTAVVFRNGVPQAIIQAELCSRDGLRVSDDELGAMLDELTTRNLFGSQWLEHHEWPRVEYQRPDGHKISTRIDPKCGLREVVLDGNCVAIEFDDRGQPKDSFACYWITSEGLAVLDGRSNERNAVDEGGPFYPCGWFKEYGIADDKLRDAKRKGRVTTKSGPGNRNLYRVADVKALWPDKFPPLASTAWTRCPVTRSPPWSVISRDQA